MNRNNLEKSELSALRATWKKYHRHGPGLSSEWLHRSVLRAVSTTIEPASWLSAELVYSFGISVIISVAVFIISASISERQAETELATILGSNNQSVMFRSQL